MWPLRALLECQLVAQPLKAQFLHCQYWLLHHLSQVQMLLHLEWLVQQHCPKCHLQPQDFSCQVKAPQYLKVQPQHLRVLHLGLLVWFRYLQVQPRHRQSLPLCLLVQIRYLQVQHLHLQSLLLYLLVRLRYLQFQPQWLLQAHSNSRSLLRYQLFQCLPYSPKNSNSFPNYLALSHLRVVPSSLPACKAGLSKHTSKSNSMHVSVLEGSLGHMKQLSYSAIMQTVSFIEADVILSWAEGSFAIRKRV